MSGTSVDMATPGGWFQWGPPRVISHDTKNSGADSIVEPVSMNAGGTLYCGAGFSSIAGPRRPIKLTLRLARAY